MNDCRCRPTDTSLGVRIFDSLLKLALPLFAILAIVALLLIPSSTFAGPLPDITIDSDASWEAGTSLGEQAIGEWKASPVWTGNFDGPTDGSGLYWHEVGFDDSGWAPITLPDVNSIPDLADRFYRLSFQVAEPSNVPPIYFESDDGIWIYVNGSFVGHWGGDWRQIVCVNRCIFNRVNVAPQDISSLLTPGTNVIAVRVSNGPTNSYFDFELPPETPFCADVTGIPDVECEALLALHEGTAGDSWQNSSGWLETTTPCTWYGVTCDAGRVAILSLHFNQLSGSIPPQLGNLTNLKFLFLHNNQLNGSMPPELGNLTNLWTLQLSANQLSGSIPPQLGDMTNLRDLLLHDNDLSGSIPSELGNLTNLWTLQLSANQLSGSIPPQLGDMTNLLDLSLHDNDLSGSIPSELGNLTNLRALQLSGNQLSGSIPPQLGDMTNLLHHLSLQSNQLSGGIPSELGNLTNLGSLVLYSNQLSGSIPPQLGDMTNLLDLLLHDNDLSGSIPSELGNLTNLGILHLYSNQLSGSIPLSLTDLVVLWSFRFNDTNLCEPDAPAFQAWLETISDLVTTGVLCDGVDADGDGIPDVDDACPTTLSGADVDTNGCSQSQVDGDRDGVCDPGKASDLWCTGSDACPGTPAGTPVDVIGCPQPVGCETSPGQNAPTEPERSVFVDAHDRVGGESVLGCATSTVQTNGFLSDCETTGHFQTFDNGAIEYHANGDFVGQAYAIMEPLFTRWVELGLGDRGNTKGDLVNPLGYPTSDLSPVSRSFNGTGTALQFQSFECDGALELHLDGQHAGKVVEIHGGIFQKWGSLGFADSVLGLPVPAPFDTPGNQDEWDALKSPDGTTGRVEQFERGHIHWHANGTRAGFAFETHGKIDDCYVDEGGTASALGFPIADQGNDNRAEFEGGYIELVGGECVLSTAPAPGEDRKVLLVQGIWSSSDEITERMAKIFLTLNDPDVRPYVSVAAVDIYGFSYVSGPGGYSDEERRLPTYSKYDTCGGIDGDDGAAKKLSDQIAYIVDRHPNATFDIVAHSMGGVVTAYALTEMPPHLRGRIHSVTTLDSPLEGVENPLAWIALVKQYGFDCSDRSSVDDLSTGSEVIKRITGDSTSPTRYLPFATVRNQFDPVVLWHQSDLRGALRTADADCNPFPNVWDIHSCVWEDNVALAVVADMVRMANVIDDSDLWPGGYTPSSKWDPVGPDDDLYREGARGTRTIGSRVEIDFEGDHAVLGYQGPDDPFGFGPNFRVEITNVGGTTKIFPGPGESYDSGCFSPHQSCRDREFPNLGSGPHHLTLTITSGGGLFTSFKFDYLEVRNSITAATTLASPALVGQSTLDVGSTSGFSVGDFVVINPGGPNEEEGQISGFGSLILSSPLQFDHEAGEPVVKVSSASAFVWGDVDCDGTVGTRDSQALLRKVLEQNALSQTQPCPVIGTPVTVDGNDGVWGDGDCDGTVGTRDSQALLRKVLQQPALSQTQPCPVIGDPVQVSEIPAADAAADADRASIVWRPYAALPSSEPMRIRR